LRAASTIAFARNRIFLFDHGLTPARRTGGSADSPLDPGTALCPDRGKSPIGVGERTRLSAAVRRCRLPTANAPPGPLE